MPEVSMSSGGDDFYGVFLTACIISAVVVAWTGGICMAVFMGVCIFVGHCPPVGRRNRRIGNRPPNRRLLGQLDARTVKGAAAHPPTEVRDQLNARPPRCHQLS